MQSSDFSISSYLLPLCLFFAVIIPPTLMAPSSSLQNSLIVPVCESLSLLIIPKRCRATVADVNAYVYIVSKGNV